MVGTGVVIGVVIAGRSQMKEVNVSACIVTATSVGKMIEQTALEMGGCPLYEQEQGRMSSFVMMVGCGVLSSCLAERKR